MKTAAAKRIWPLKQAGASVLLLAALLGGLLVYSRLLLLSIRQIDTRGYYNLNSDVLYYNCAINAPLLAGIALVSAATLWLITQLLRRRWPVIGAGVSFIYFVQFCVFFFLLEMLDFGNFL